MRRTTSVCARGVIRTWEDAYAVGTGKLGRARLDRLWARPIEVRRPPVDDDFRRTPLR